MRNGTVGTRTRPVPLGQWAAIGEGWDLRVVRFRAKVPGTDPAFAAFDRKRTPEGRQYLVARLEARYNASSDDGDGAKKSIAPFAKAVGRTAVQASSRGCPILVRPLVTLDDVFPGGSVSGDACWVTSADDDAFLVYAAQGFTTNDVWFATE